MRTKSLSFFCLTLFFFFAVFPAYAQSQKLIQSKYQDVYTLDNTRAVKVEKQIELVNMTDRLYVSEYELAFGNFDGIGNLAVWEDGKPAVFNETRGSRITKLNLKFQQPSAGKGASKTVTISYVLDDYLSQSGNYRELLIPISQPSQNEELLSYEVRVVVPNDYPEAGISKPKATQLDFNTYQWLNVDKEEAKALFISFSNKAYYRINLNYILVNQDRNSRLLNAALVPDGAFQKAYIDKIEPKPERIFLDADGNLLASFKVAGSSVLKVVYSGYVELFTKPRREVQDYQQFFLPLLNTRYLTQEQYWYLSSETLAGLKSEELNSSLAVYDYVVEKLEYDTGRINKNLKRLGAEWVFQNSNQALCMDYTDLFIALTREKGIPSRGVVGYGLTMDDQLLPSSFLGDILHAWPEYFDSARQIWLPVDPTWEDTSGIDYFHSFDLSHIAFVYHGKNADSPLPPGVYKIDPNSRDIVVIPIDAVPVKKTNWEVIWPKNLFFAAGQSNHFEIKLKSEASDINYGVKLNLIDKKTKRVLARKKLKAVPPLSEQKIVWQIPAKKLKLGSNQTLQLTIDDSFSFARKYSVLPAYLYWLKTYCFWLALPVLLIAGFYLTRWRS